MNYRRLHPSVLIQRVVGLLTSLEALLLAFVAIGTLGWTDSPLENVGMLAASVAFALFAFHMFDTGHPEERPSDRLLWLLLVTIVISNLTFFGLMLFSDDWSASGVSDFVVSTVWELGVSLASIAAVLLRIRDTREAKRLHPRKNTPLP